MLYKYTLLIYMVVTALLGYVGGMITTSGGVPQIIQMINTKKTVDVSWGMLVLWFIGLSLTLVYAIKVHQPPICMSSSVSLTMTLIMGGIKYYYEHIKCVASSYSQLEEVV